MGRPVLVGTISIEKSEYLSALLTKRGVKHNVLNAKQHERETYIIAQAGRVGAVTIATNMAGRGTDILLGGNATYSQIKDNDEEVDFVLSTFTDRGNYNFILTASIESGDKTVKNSEGKDVELKGHHAYSVVGVKDGYVSVINPEDSSIVYTITIDSFKQSFDSITYLDLNELS